MNPIGYLETGVLICGDNMERLPDFPDECVDLIYLDPPFFSNRHYEVIWGDEAEVRSFEDRWKGGINHYIEWMRERMVELHRVLKPTGSLYLHCDWHASHYLKVMTDQVFGTKNFLNNVVWLYGLGGSSTRYWPRKHDDLLWYSKKSDKHYFQADKIPATSQRMRGQLKKAPDYWGIPAINNRARERLGYPTQKPEALLERIVRSSSRKGDIVLDPFAGCGTCLVAAERLARQWIGIDISPTAANVMLKRMRKIGAENIKTYGLPRTEADLRTLKPFEFQNWIIQHIHGKHSPRKTGDMGIDGFSFLEQLPIQIKQSDRVGRNVVDNFETAVRRAGKHKGYIIAFSFGRGAYEEAARAKAEGLEIALIEVKTLIEGADAAPLPALDQMTADLLQSVRAVAKEPRGARPERSIEELIESDTTVSTIES